MRALGKGPVTWYGTPAAMTFTWVLVPPGATPKVNMRKEEVTSVQFMVGVGGGGPPGGGETPGGGGPPGPGGGWATTATAANVASSTLSLKAPPTGADRRLATGEVEEGDGVRGWRGGHGWKGRSDCWVRGAVGSVGSESTNGQGRRAQL